MLKQLISYTYSYIVLTPFIRERTNSVRRSPSMFDVECSMFDVHIESILILFFFDNDR